MFETPTMCQYKYPKISHIRRVLYEKKVKFLKNDLRKFSNRRDIQFGTLKTF